MQYYVTAVFTVLAGDHDDASAIVQQALDRGSNDEGAIVEVHVDDVEEDEFYEPPDDDAEGP